MQHHPPQELFYVETGFDARGIKMTILTRKIRYYFVSLSQMVPLAALKIMIIQDYFNYVLCFFRVH